MKHLIFLLLFFISAQSFAQNNLTWGKTVEATQRLKVSGNTVDSISKNATATSKSDSKLITERAAKLYADAVAAGGGGGGTDSVTVSGDSLFYWNAGTRYFVTLLSSAVAGGDTTIFATVLDSTGQINNRLLFAKNNKISSSPRLLFDSANNKVVINNSNSSVGGSSTKLFIGGNTQINGNLIIAPMPTTSDTANYKPLVLFSTGSGTVTKLNRWPVVNDPSKASQAALNDSAAAIRAAFPTGGSGSISGLYEKIISTASQTVFNYTTIPADRNKFAIYVYGVLVDQSKYGVASNTITFSNGIQNGADVIVQGVQ